MAISLDLKLRLGGKATCQNETTPGQTPATDVGVQGQPAGIQLSERKLKLTPMQKIGASLAFTAAGTGGAFGVDMMTNATPTDTAVALNDVKNSACVQMAQNPADQARGSVLAECRKTLTEVNRLGQDADVAQLPSFSQLQESLINLYASAEAGDDTTLVANADQFSKQVLAWLDSPEVKELASGNDKFASILNVLRDLAVSLPAAAGIVATSLSLWRQVDAAVNGKTAQVTTSGAPPRDPAQQQPWPSKLSRQAEAEAATSKREIRPDQAWGPWSEGDAGNAPATPKT